MKIVWTPELHRVARDAYMAHMRAHGPYRVWQVVVAALRPHVPDVTIKAAQNHLQRAKDWDVVGARPAFTEPETPSANEALDALGLSARSVSRITSVIEYPPRPFETRIEPGAALIDTGKMQTAVVYCDEHQPFVDEKAMQLVRGVIREVQPDYVGHLGDGVDCYPLSKYDTDPHRHWNIQQDIDAFKRSLHATADAAPSARRILLEGNHEDRLRRLVWGLPERGKQLVQLDAVREALEWPKLLDLDGVGFEWGSIEDQPIADFLPKMIMVHGSRLSPHAGYSARLELEKWGHTGISGHTHRMAVHPRRDYNGQTRWIEGGFVASYKQPYGTHFNWQQGMTVLEWSADLKLMQEHLLFFRDGRVLWRDRELVAL